MDGSIETPLFMAESGEKNGKIILEKKVEIFSIFSSVFSPYNREY